MKVRLWQIEGVDAPRYEPSDALCDPADIGGVRTATSADTFRDLRNDVRAYHATGRRPIPYSFVVIEFKSGRANWLVEGRVSDFAPYLDPEHDSSE